MRTSPPPHDTRRPDNLRAELRLLEAAAVANIDGITISDAGQDDMPLVYVNPGFEKMTGYAKDEIIGRNCRFLQGDDRDQPALQEIREAIEAGRPCRVTLRNYRKDGTLFWNELTLYPLHDEAGHLTHYVGIQRDVTERKDAEQRLAHSERLLNLAQQIAHLGNWEWNLNDGALTWSTELYRITGLDPEAPISFEQFAALVHPDDRERVMAAFEEARTKLEPFHFDHRFIRPDGDERILFEQGEVLREDDGDVVKLFGTAQDITGRRRVEQRLRLLEATAHASVDGITISDAGQDDMPLVYVSPGFEKMTGYAVEEALGHNCRFLQGDDRDQPALREIREAIEAGRPCRVTLRNYRKDGTFFWNELTLYPLHDEAGHLTHYVGIQRDVTERKKLEAQFLQVQRLESIGRLVSGIAHDLGNLLMPILLGVKVLQQRYPDDEKAMRTLSLIQQSGQRGAEMVKQVLNFARGVEGERVPLQPEQVLREVEKIASDTFPRSLDIETHIPDDLWWIEGDATQIQQILMNLCVNARDAMPEGGRLTIEAANVTLDKTMARMNLEARPGRFVRLAVTDTGTGMPPDVVDKVFEPFFSTKPSSRGTGLGLSTVYSIVKSHDGFVTVYSEVGAGTTFHVYLPVTSRTGIVQDESPPTIVRKGAGELILVIDDEPYILEATQEALERAEYRVVTATNGAEALALFDEKEATIAAVLTDLVMPEMDGIATIRALRERDPERPIIAASGMGEARAPEALDAGADLFLAKPFTAEKLYEALDHLLRVREEGEGRG